MYQSWSWILDFAQLLITWWFISYFFALFIAVVVAATAAAAAAAVVVVKWTYFPLRCLLHYLYISLWTRNADSCWYSIIGSNIELACLLRFLPSFFISFSSSVCFTSKTFAYFQLLCVCLCFFFVFSWTCTWKPAAHVVDVVEISGKAPIMGHLLKKDSFSHWFFTS